MLNNSFKMKNSQGKTYLSGKKGSDASLETPKMTQ
jgi:hypothetical protein